MQYTIEFFSQSVEDDILDLPETLLARFFSLADRMITSGANLGEPHTKAMGDGLFELRLKGAEGQFQYHPRVLLHLDKQAYCDAEQFC
jgi:phage-related protein